jgi:hypothetical protein
MLKVRCVLSGSKLWRHIFDGRWEDMAHGLAHDVVKTNLHVTYLLKQVPMTCPRELTRTAL